MVGNIITSRTDHVFMYESDRNYELNTCICELIPGHLALVVETMMTPWKLVIYRVVAPGPDPVVGWVYACDVQVVDDTHSN